MLESDSVHLTITLIIGFKKLADYANQQQEIGSFTQYFPTTECKTIIAHTFSYCIT